ncbi:MAG: hypothetical protein KF900_04920 [Bacteroidetes bacterium]|nr:hypothetical protein [Bacteroidota bacterium]
MEEYEVTFTTEVEDYLFGLSFTLYADEYFGFIEQADRFVDYIAQTIKRDVHKLKHYPVPKDVKYADYYIVVRLPKNKHTAYHAYFKKKDNRYLVTKISNNHEPEAKFLNDF